MGMSRATELGNKARRYYTGAAVPVRAIRGFARAVAKRFHPDKIILFGSYAYGEPKPDSDVDILVVMPARNQVSQAVRIRMALPDPPFPLDLIVRAPGKLRKRLEDGDSFTEEIVGKGTVLHEKGHATMDSQSRGGFQGRESDLARGSE